MTRGVSWFLVAPLVLLGLSGCKFGLFDRREPWRSEAEERCLAGGEVKPSAYIIPVREIDGAGTCGMDHPFRVLAFNQGTVEVAPKATLACPMTSAVDRWMLEDIQPAAMAWFGQPVAKVKQMSSYSCRNMNGGPAGKISEHAFGNALDIGGFELADGRVILVKTGWKGRPDEQGFLRTVQATGCQRFTTTLGPGYNIYHYDHIHVDLMRRAGRTSCNPNVTPPRPPNLPVFKAPPMMRPMSAAPMANAAEAEAEPGTQEDFGPGSAPAAAPASSYPAAGYPAAAPAYPAPVARAPAAPMAAPARLGAPVQPSRLPAAAPAPLGAPGEPMPLTPQPGYGAGYGHGVDPNYQAPAAPPPAARPATGYPSQQAYPPQGYPAGGYPAGGYPTGGYPAQPAPSAYPAQGYPTQGYPAQAYPAQGYPAPKPAAAPKPAPATTRPPGVPLPPAGIPLAKWLGLDTTPTGSTGTAASSNVRSFTNERRFASPIPGPEAEGGTD